MPAAVAAVPNVAVVGTAFNPFEAIPAQQTQMPGPGGMGGATAYRVAIPPPPPPPVPLYEQPAWCLAQLVPHGNLAKCDLSGRRFAREVLTGVNMQQVTCINCDFSMADLRESDLTEANFAGSRLDGANFNRATLHLTNLSNAIASSADFTDANLNGEIAHRTDLSGAELSYAIFNRAKLSHVDLSGAVLFSARCARQSFEYATRRRPEAPRCVHRFAGVEAIEGSVLAGADFTRAEFTGVVFSQARSAEMSRREI